MHFGWNWALVVFGLNVSGFKMGVTGFVVRWRVSDLWSGGAYGPEASVLTCGVIVGLLWVLHRAPFQPPRSLRRYFDVPCLPVVGVAGNLVVTASSLFAEKLTTDQRIEILRGMTAEYATAKTYLPKSKKPLEYKSTGEFDKARMAGSRQAARTGRPAGRSGSDHQG